MGSSELLQVDDVSHLMQLQFCSKLPSHSQPAAAAAAAAPSASKLGSLESKCVMASSRELETTPFSAAPRTGNPANKFDFPSAQRDILAGLQAPGRLGLSSHSETDWLDQEPVQQANGDEDMEDMDVLSLYEFDTFLESEEESDEWGHGTSLPERFVDVVFTDVCYCYC